MQAQAEETLNTLHFASMALRVKCNPLQILDPQDKLVLGLRGTITKLKQENQQLSTALQRSRSNSGEGSRESARDFEYELPQVSANEAVLVWLGHPRRPPSRPAVSLHKTLTWACHSRVLKHSPPLVMQSSVRLIDGDCLGSHLSF